VAATFHRSRASNPQPTTSAASGPCSSCICPVSRDESLFKVDLWDEAKDTEILRWAAEQGARPLHRSGRPRIAFRREHLRRDLLDGDAKSAMDIGVITEGIDESQLAEATTRVGIGICASVRSFPKNQYYTSMASCRIIVCPRGWGENCNCHCDAWISGKPVLTDRKCDSVDDQGV
jgi:hypothetical protein